MNDAVSAQLEAGLNMRERLDALVFGPPVVSVYDPLDYAWNAFEEYITLYGGAKGRVLFLGMNPGPWGMAQTGVPFGEVSFVRDWLKIGAPIGAPKKQHPKYPVLGYDTPQSEVSGRRLWGLFKERYGDADTFFKSHFVVNYCPLLFIASATLKNGKESARNLTPDKLAASERKALYEVCDEHLHAVVQALEPCMIVGVGNFAEGRAKLALEGTNVKIGRILHPSPASPRSNANWAGEAAEQLEAMGIW